MDRLLRQLKVVAIMATYGRHDLCERAVGMFLTQTYENKHLIIMQNSTRECTLDKSIGANNNITLINRSGYQNLGEIYTDSLQYIPADADLVCFWDDDDIYLPKHIITGVYMFKAAIARNANYAAVKYMYSLYMHGDNISYVNNTLEPSWFIRASAIKQYGFNLTTGSQHRAWVDPIISEGKCLENQNFIPTFCYTWGNGVYKTSGDVDAVDNFQNFRNESSDFGDDIITPYTTSALEEIYEPIYNFLGKFSHINN